MGLFSNDDTDELKTLRADVKRLTAMVDDPDYQPTLDETSEQMKATAIEYMVSLDKKDFDGFVEGVTLIWQGYNNNVDKVRTRHQKALQRSQNKPNGADAPTTDEEDDDLIASFLDEDEAGKTNPLVTPPATTLPPLPPKRPLGGGSATDVTKKVEVKG